MQKSKLKFREKKTSLGIIYKLRQAKTELICFIWKCGCVLAKQPTNWHRILMQMLLHPDWCLEVHDITFFQHSPAPLKPMEKCTEKNRNHVK